MAEYEGGRVAEYEGGRVAEGGKAVTLTSIRRAVVGPALTDVAKCGGEAAALGGEMAAEAEHMSPWPQA
ncbi:hypothetical protein Pth03_80730 [Planotetraspora thailandica]|uniref:Uncharacterized protein n=1 Tax=Planotetraspora thailandica TaxID=487172 RepID=A0A8J4DF64_9ACTN|nr:hypothetical protein Pth03_80730 [Planotetraspora thailandica]